MSPVEQALQKLDAAVGNLEGSVKSGASLSIVGSNDSEQSEELVERLDNAIEKVESLLRGAA